MQRFLFPKSSRLLKSRDFDRVFAAKCSTRVGPLIVHAAKSDLGRTRLGLVVSRKVGKAIVRNRWKRRLREAFRLSQHALPTGLDLVVIPRGTTVPKPEVVQHDLQSAASRLHRRLESSR